VIGTFEAEDLESGEKITCRRVSRTARGGARRRCVEILDWRGRRVRTLYEEVFFERYRIELRGTVVEEAGPQAATG
jgi:hypothetical protein